MNVLLWDINFDRLPIICYNMSTKKSGDKMKNNVLSTEDEGKKLVELSAEALGKGIDEFLSDPRVQEQLSAIKKSKVSYKNYISVVNSLVNSLNILGSSREKLIELLTSKFQLEISYCRDLLRYEGNLAWEEFKKKNPTLYNNFSIVLMNALQNHSVRLIRHKYQKEIDTICEVTGITQEKFIYLMEQYKKLISLDGPKDTSDFSSSIKNIIKSFNAKAKEQFISKYIEEHTNDFSDFFTQKKQQSYYHSTENYSIFMQIVKGNQTLRQKIRNIISEFYGEVVEEKDLQTIILNILKGNDEENLKLFGLTRSSYPPNFDLYGPSKAVCRAQRILKELNKSKHKYKEAQLAYIYCDDESRVQAKCFISSGDFKTLEELRILLKEGNCRLVYDKENNMFELETDYHVLDETERAIIKRFISRIKGYTKLQLYIFRLFHEQTRILNEQLNVFTDEEDDTSLSFTDDNYSFNQKKISELYDIDYIIELLKALDVSTLGENLTKENFKKLKDFLIGKHFLPLSIVRKNDPKFVAQLINNMDFITQYGNIESINYNILNKIKKLIKLNELDYDLGLLYIILGPEVTEKIVNDTSFIEERNGFAPDSKESIEERLRRAIILMREARKKDLSSIPYFEPVTYENITFRRYNNNDPRVLISGIESKTCFKITGNDNDYLFYSVGNQNGAVIEIIEDGKMCGRATIHLYGNVLMINGIRNKNNTYDAMSLEEAEKNKKIVESLKLFAKTLIESTSTAECPIDFVVCNKAGILESSAFDNDFMMVDNYIIDTHIIDTNNDSFIDFVETFGDCLQEAPHFESGTKPPFTTDFGGHYPVYLIASRNNVDLRSIRQIAYTSQPPVYKRREIFTPIYGKGCLSEDVRRMIDIIDAYHFLETTDNIKEYTRKKHDMLYDKYYVCEDGYHLISDGVDETIVLDFKDSIRASIEQSQSTKAKAPNN